ncbi:MAG: hypothetical protein ACRD3Q_15265, partial [Terriglobales bacterium]
AGLGPTHVYRGSDRDGQNIWAFPVLHMGKEASLEEMEFDDIPISAVHDWFLATTDFTVREHTARLIYAHPYGAERFFKTLESWLDDASVLQKEGRFRWYTMTELARFLNQRQSTEWSLLRSSSGKTVLRASNAATLNHQTWVFPQRRYRDARVVEGRAQIKLQDGMIFVDAGDGRKLSIELSSGGDAGRARSELIEAKR